MDSRVLFSSIALFSIMSGHAGVPSEKEAGTDELIVIAQGESLDLAKQSITGKKLKLEGTGVQGEGALFTSGGKTFFIPQSIELTGDTLFSGNTKPFGLSGNKECPRIAVTGKGAVLGLAGKSMGLYDLDLDLKGVLVKQGAYILFKSLNATLVDGMVLENGSKIWFGSLPLPNFQIQASGGKSDLWVEIGGTSEMNAPLVIAEGSTLEINVRSLNSRLQYGEGFSCQGGGTLFLGGGKNTRHEILADIGNIALRTASFTTIDAPHSISNLSLNAQVETVLNADSISNITFSGNSRINLGGVEITDSQTKGDILRSAGNGRVSKLGRNASLTFNSLFFSPLAQSGRLILEEGSSLDILGPWAILGYTQIKDPKDSKLETDLILDGGSFTATNIILDVGFFSPHARFHVKNGTATLRGVSCRPHDGQYKEANRGYLDPAISDEAYVQSGGTVNMMRGGFSTPRGYPRSAQIYLNGGTMNSLEDWKARDFMHLYFGSYLGAKGECFTLNTSDKEDGQGRTLTLHTALQGDGAVRLTGTGSLLAGSSVQGGVSGPWSIENLGGADLSGAASFAGGLSLADGTRGDIAIGDTSRYVSAGVYYWDVVFYQTFPTHTPVLGWFADRMGSLLTEAIGNSLTYIVYEGEFKVDPADAGDYTFACTHAKEITLTVNGKSVKAVGGKVEPLPVALAEGWNRFKIVARTSGGAVDTSKWFGTGDKMCVGFAKGTVSPSTDFSAFDTGSFSGMRPAQSAWQGVIPLSGDDFSRDWRTRRDYASVSLQGGLEMDGKLGIKESWGTFRVGADQAGEWMFSASETFKGFYFFEVDGVPCLDSEDKGLEGRVSLTPGFHTFRSRVYLSAGVAPVDGSLLYCRIGSNGAQPFGSGSIPVYSASFGHLGGEIGIGTAAELANTSETACPITGRLSGEGRLIGNYRFAGGTMAYSCLGQEQDPRSVDLSEVPGDVLKDAGKIHVTFEGIPRKSRYILGDSRGLTQEKVAGMLEVSLLGVPESEVENVRKAMSLKVKDGQTLILENGNLQGTVLLLK